MLVAGETKLREMLMVRSCVAGSNAQHVLIANEYHKILKNGKSKRINCNGPKKSMDGRTGLHPAAMDTFCRGAGRTSL